MKTATRCVHLNPGRDPFGAPARSRGPRQRPVRHGARRFARRPAGEWGGEDPRPLGPGAGGAGQEFHQEGGLETRPGRNGIDGPRPPRPP